jgi:hypothetical protein
MVLRISTSGLLKHILDGLTECLDANICDFVAIKQNFAFFEVVAADNELHDGRLGVITGPTSSYLF